MSSFNTDSQYRRNKYALDEHEELQKIHERINVVEDESLKSTQRALGRVLEAEDLGIKTNAELHKQGEQLRNIDRNLDDINDDLQETERNLNKVESVFGGIVNFFSGKKKSKKDSAADSDFKPKDKDKKEKKKDKKGAEAIPAKPEFKKITGTARENEMEKNLDQISDVLSRMKMSAVATTSELERQNHMLDKINGKAQNAESVLYYQSDKMRKIIK